MKRYIRSTTESFDNQGNTIDETASDRLISSKIRNRKGQLILCYHGTNAQFDDFLDDFIGTNSNNIGWFGKGFYFTDSAKLASSYGSILRKCYLNITHPFIFSSEDSIYELYNLGYEHVRIFNDRLAPFAYLDEADNYMVDEFTDVIKSAGYDGVVFSYRQAKYKGNIPGTSTAHEYVCFNSNQVVWVE